MAKTTRTLLLAFFGACCTLQPKPDAVVRSELSSTVRIRVAISGRLLQKNGNSSKIEAGWAGSGVAYKHVNHDTWILTANHVVGVPAVGQLYEIDAKKTLVVDSVGFYVDTFDGQTCPAKPVKGGGGGAEDVAVIKAFCESGSVAVLSLEEPPTGAKVQAVGHPQGVDVGIVTEGYITGHINGMEVFSAPISHGSSGGGLWYNGKLVGITAQVHREFSSIAFAVPLEAIKRRMAEAEAMK